MFPILILRVLPCSFLSSGFSTTCLHKLLPPKCRSSCGSHMPSAHLGTACHGCSVAQPATHTANPCVPACCRAGHPSSQWDSCLAERLQRPGKCNGLADPASVSEAASQKQQLAPQSSGVSFGKGSRFPNSDTAVPLQHCYLNGLRKLCLSKVPSGFIVAPTPLSQVECGGQTH